jgi:hypothetical protein
MVALTAAFQISSNVSFWIEPLGTDDLLHVPTIGEATERLRLLLHDKMNVAGGGWRLERR